MRLLISCKLVGLADGAAIFIYLYMPSGGGPLPDPHADPDRDSLLYYPEGVFPNRQIHFFLNN